MEPAARFLKGRRMDLPADHSGAEIVIQGIVVPTLWDALGNPLRVSILTADEGEYEVVPRGMGRRLIAFVTEEIKARVVAQEDVEGDVVKVVSFTVVRRAPGRTATIPVRGQRRSKRGKPSRSVGSRGSRGS
jgi:hypothetical protein